MPIDIHPLLKEITDQTLFDKDEAELIAKFAMRAKEGSDFDQLAITSLLFKGSRETTLAVARMIEAIDRFNDQTDKQTRKMLLWTKVLAGLTIILALQTLFLILQSP